MKKLTAISLLIIWSIVVTPYLASAECKGDKCSNVKLTVDPTSLMVLPNFNATYTLTIENTGEKKDTYDLTINNSDNADYVRLNKSTVTLVSGENTTVKLEVSDDDIGTYNVTVTATSQKRGYEDSVTTTTIVSTQGIPEFQNIVIPISLVLILGILVMKLYRRKQYKEGI